MKEIDLELLNHVAGGGDFDPSTWSGASPIYGPYPYQRSELNPVPDPVAPEPQP